jgi:uncharacterized protein (DUF1810 family)
MFDRYRLQRFVSAQDNGVYRAALAELSGGRKAGHWMWFIFPQIAGLGLSSVSRKYAISSLREAQLYLAHPVLGPRLLECARALVDLDESDAVRVLGYTDALKLRSSMTLFGRAAPAEPLFQCVLDKYFSGQPDLATLDRL